MQCEEIEDRLNEVLDQRRRPTGMRNCICIAKPAPNVVKRPWNMA